VKSAAEHPTGSKKVRVWRWFRYLVYFVFLTTVGLGYLEYSLWNTYGRSAKFLEEARSAYDVVAKCDDHTNDTTFAFDECVTQSRQWVDKLRSDASRPGERILGAQAQDYLNEIVACRRDNDCVSSEPGRLQTKNRLRERMASQLK